MSINIRYAVPSELVALEDLQRRASLAVERYRIDLLLHPEAIHLPLSQVLENNVRAAEISGQVVGFSAVIAKGAHIFELDGLFVEPNRWGSGIGCALITDAMQVIVAQGGFSLEVVANAAAEAFYEKMHFTALCHVETQFGTGRLMRREIQL